MSFWQNSIFRAALVGWLLLGHPLVDSLGAPVEAGEVLKFDAYYGPVLGAEFELRRRGAPGAPGGWSVEAECKSRGVVELFYQIRSRAVSTPVPGSFFTRSFYENRSEGGHRYHRFQYLDWRKKWGVWENYESGDRKKIKVDRPACDLLTAVYLVRGMDWVPGQVRSVTVFSDGKYHELPFVCESRGAEQDPAWKGRPVMRLRSDGIFEAVTKRKGQLLVSVSDDPARLPLTARLKVSWGTISLRLK